MYVHVPVTAVSADARVQGMVYPFCRVTLKSSRRNATIPSRHSGWDIKRLLPGPPFLSGIRCLGLDRKLAETVVVLATVKIIARPTASVSSQFSTPP